MKHPAELESRNDAVQNPAFTVTGAHKMQCSNLTLFLLKTLAQSVSGASVFPFLLATIKGPVQKVADGPICNLIGTNQDHLGFNQPAQIFICS